MLDEQLSLKQKMVLTISEIRDLYINSSNNDPWVVAWSGGKDSTVLLSMMCLAMLAVPEDKRNKRIRVVMSDTKMENPLLEQYMHEQSELVNQWAIRNNVPMDVTIVSRPLERSFFYLILGKGYVLPENRATRWCTHALKIEPQNQFIQSVSPEYLLIGTRSDESARRAVTVEKYREAAGSHFSKSPYNPGIRLYTPIVDYTTEEIWEILKRPLPWGDSGPIRTLYKEATGECALINPNGVTEFSSGCGARFGCWTCPPIKKDKSTENMSQIHKWMVPLTIWRKELLEQWDAKKHPENRSGYRRDGKPAGENKGTITIQARKYMFHRLIKTEEEVNRLRELEGLPPICIISEEEKEMIKSQWLKDERERPWLIDSSEYREGDFESARIELNMKKRLREGRKKQNARFVD